nr:chaplin family protein [uncultured Actinoplanes sp.]
MKTWVRKTLSVGVLAAGALLFAPAAAQADSHQSNGDNVGLLNGTQIVAPIKVPVNVVGNSIAILGGADSQSAGVNHIESGKTKGGWGPNGGAIQSNGDNVGLLNGTQAYLPVNVPVNVVGNSVAVLGGADSRSVGVNKIGRNESARTEGHRWDDRTIQSNGDNVGFLNGTQLYAPIDIPVNVCGNSIALLGGATSRTICANVIGDRRRESAKVTEDAIQSNGDNVGVANGTQLFAPITLPVNLSGNSIAALGGASSRTVSVNSVESTHPDVVQSNGHNVGVLNGTQAAVPINVPINACGNSLGLLLGGASSSAVCYNGIGDVLGDRDDFDGWDGDRCGDRGWAHDRHGCKGHGHKGHHGHGNGNDNAGDNGDDDQYAGDNGDKDDQGAKPAHNGYGGTKPAHSGYGDEKPVATGSKSDSDGGREALPVGGVSDTVGGVTENAGLGSLGLLSTLR